MEKCRAVCVCVWVERECVLLMCARPLQESRRVVLSSSEKTRYSLTNIPQSHAIIFIIFMTLNTLVLTPSAQRYLTHSSVP